jgi:two-component system, NarL family, nitrate/nitrite response regulator NarL
VRFLVVDDDFGSRAGMAATLSDVYAGSEVLQEGSVQGAIAVLQRAPVDLVLLDLNVEDSRGIATLQKLKEWCEDHECNPRIVVVSGAADYDDGLIPQAIEHCATGFITKGCSIAIFRSAIELTLAGTIYIPERYLQGKRLAAPRAEDEIVFTKRERQVAALLIQGLTYKQIARRLAEPGRDMSDNTVRVHVQRMAWKLRVTGESDGDSRAAKAAVITAVAEKRLQFRLDM